MKNSFLKKIPFILIIFLLVVNCVCVDMLENIISLSASKDTSNDGDSNNAKIQSEIAITKTGNPEFPFLIAHENGEISVLFSTNQSGLAKLSKIIPIKQLDKINLSPNEEYGGG